MILIFSLLIIFAMLSTKLSSKTGLPLLIGFILVGILAGSDVLNLYYFDNALLTKRIADILLIFIIFEGGFRITKKNFESVAGTSITLATLGVALTSSVLGIFIHYFLKLDIIYSFIIASIISSTDASAVFMITKENPIKNKLATTLNIESAANDPMAILLTLTFIQIYTKTFHSPIMAIILLIWQFFGGILIGYICYKTTLFIFDKFQSDNRGNYNILIIGCILFTYGISDLLHANSIISVFFMGYWFGNKNFPSKQGVSNFLESITIIFNITIFIMLGLLAFPSRFIYVWKSALFIVFVMMFIARPVAVFLSTLFFKYNYKEKIFLMWGGIKGAVPIVLATYPAAYGMKESNLIFDSIFFAVFLSCIIQGTTLATLAKFLKFTEKRKPLSPYSVELHSTKTTNFEMYEILVQDNAPCINKKLFELNFDKDVLISSIIRNGNLILPKGNTTIKENDILYILTNEIKINEINQRINS